MSDVVTKFLAGAFGVVALYLLISDGGAGANNVLRGLGEFNQKTFSTLQGR